MARDRKSQSAKPRRHIPPGVRPTPRLHIAQMATMSFGPEQTQAVVDAVGHAPDSLELLGRDLSNAFMRFLAETHLRKTQTTRVGVEVDRVAATTDKLIELLTFALQDGHQFALLNHKANALGFPDADAFLRIMLGQLNRLSNFLYVPDFRDYKQIMRPEQDLIANSLGGIFKERFGAKVSVSRAKDERLTSPFLRFAKAALDLKGVLSERKAPFTEEAIRSKVKAVLELERRGGAYFVVQDASFLVRQKQP